MPRSLSALVKMRRLKLIQQFLLQMILLTTTWVKSRNTFTSLELQSICHAPFFVFNDGVHLSWHALHKFVGEKTPQKNTRYDPFEIKSISVSSGHLLQ